jgi:hypothetical protein
VGASERDEWLRAARRASVVEGLDVWPLLVFVDECDTNTSFVHLYARVRQGGGRAPWCSASGRRSRSIWGCWISADRFAVREGFYQNRTDFDPRGDPEPSRRACKAVKQTVGVQHARPPASGSVTNKSCRFGSVSNLKDLIRVTKVLLYGELREIETLGYLSICQSFGDEC